MLFRETKEKKTGIFITPYSIGKGEFLNGWYTKNNQKAFLFQGEKLKIKNSLDEQILKRFSKELIFELSVVDLVICFLVYPMDLFLMIWFCEHGCSPSKIYFVTNLDNIIEKEIAIKNSILLSSRRYLFAEEKDSKGCEIMKNLFLEFLEKGYITASLNCVVLSTQKHVN